MILLGDCLERLKELESESVDMVLTSPPYDSLRSYECLSFDHFQTIAQELARVLVPGGVIVWVVGDATIKGSETGTSFRQALFFKNTGLNLHDTMIYWKGFAKFPDKIRYGQSFDYMFVFSKGKPKTFNPLTEKTKNYTGKPKTISDRHSDNRLYKKVAMIRPYKTLCNVWKINSGYMKSTTYKDAYKHPAIFPEKLAEDHILSWTNIGDTVLDPFLGSGTTAVMAQKLGRKFIGIEMNEEYCAIARKRIEHASSDE